MGSFRRGALMREPRSGCSRAHGPRAWARREREGWVRFVEFTDGAGMNGDEKARTAVTARNARKCLLGRGLWMGRSKKTTNPAARAAQPLRAAQRGG